MQLDHTVLEMGKRVEEMLDGAVDALARQDCSSARALYDQERVIEQLGARVEALALATLARPDGPWPDRCRAVAALQVGNELEHLTWLAQDVARQVPPRPTRPPYFLLRDLCRLGEIARRGLRDPLEALARRSTALARSSSREARQEAALHESLLTNLHALMRQDPFHISSGVPLVLACSALARCCEHAARIARHVERMLEAPPPPELPPNA